MALVLSIRMRRLSVVYVLCLLAMTLPIAAQWQLQDSHTTASLRGIHSLGNGVAWASGTNGTILRTLDGGIQWQTCTVPTGAEKLDFRGIQAFDDKTAIVMSSGKGDLSRLYKTVDGCQSWKLVFTNPDKEGFWDAVRFNTRDNGVLLGDPVDGIFVVMLTFNGGSKWERQTLKATEDINGEAVFAASNSSLLATYAGDRSFCTGGVGGPRVISLGSGPTDTAMMRPKTLPWETVLQAVRLSSSRSLSTSGCFSLAEDQKGYGTVVAVGGNYSQPDERYDTAWTNVFENSRDPSFGFHASRTTPHGYRSAVAYAPEHKGWITVGPNGTDLSTDNGKNWRALKPGKDDAEGADRDWNSLSLPFVVGPKGRIGKLRPAALTQSK